MKATVGYYGMHKRLKKNPAWRHLCVDCGKLAMDWSYIGDDPDELTEWVNKNRPKPTLAKYSVDMKYYQPRCRSCHLKFDNKRRREDRSG